MNVLFMTPPPIPISVEKNPIRTPMIDRTGLPGMSAPRRQLSRLKTSRSPTAGTLTVLWPGLRNGPPNPLEALLGSTTGVVAFLGVAVFAGAVREELQRAFVLHRFDQSLGGGWLGVVVFSLAFGLGHRLQGWDATIVTGLLGALWGATYLLRRSVVASMISHAGFNVIEIVMVLAWTDRAV